MPKLKKYVEHVCLHCRHYEILIGTGPYCRYFKRPFPEPYRWIRNPLKLKPGLRTCGNWNK